MTTNEEDQGWNNHEDTFEESLRRELWPQELQYFCFKKIWKNLPKLITQY